ncbi:MAG: DUF2150 family protein [Methanosarcinales archaeon]|nr:DUF2150 family protein [Methanosarcinales archaeon]
MKEEFYTQKRWVNWINKVRESKFELTDSGEGEGGAVFVYIMDDVVLACLKVIARWEHGLISPEEALAATDTIREIVNEDHDSLGEDADMMLASLKASLAAVFISSQSYIAGGYDRDTPLPDLVKAALEAEEKEDLEGVLTAIGQIGARVIGGESLPEDVSSDMPYCMVAELLDGIDAIAAAMLGDDSYKDEDGSDAEDES